MSSIIVKKELCKQCGICINECPMRVLDTNEENFPILLDTKKAFCNECGHCEASCPNQAIFLEGDRLKGSPGIAKVMVGKDHINYLVRSRRSIRNYKNHPVKRETIEEIMDTVRYAPSGMNSQCVNWMIIYNKEELSKLSDFLYKWIKETSIDNNGNTPFHNLLKAKQMDVNIMVKMWEQGIDTIFYNAPHLAITHIHKNTPTSTFDSIIALSYFDITLPAYKLGGCWAGFFHLIARSYPQLSELIGLPKDHIITGAIMFGHPKPVYHNIPKRNEANIIWN